MNDKSIAGETIIAEMQASSTNSDATKASGQFSIDCLDNDGRVIWSENFPNLITTLGKNLILDQGFTSAAYMGLITSSSYSAVAVTDTMASHAGWLEASGTNAPSYGSTRPTCAWSAAAGGSKAISPGLPFVFTNSGTIQGLFISGGSGASATVGSTAGILVNAGTLSTPQPVIVGNTIVATWTGTLA